MARSKGARSATGRVLNLKMPKYFLRWRTRLPPGLAWMLTVQAHHVPEAGPRRVSLVLVMRRQVQPVLLETRSSPVPGAPQL
jgi:hypothetical protein